MSEPAFTCSVCPVMRPAPDEQKNATACAMSSGLSTAPIGFAMPDLLAAYCSASSLGMSRRVIAVSTRPGATTFAVTPCSAPSSATVFVNAISPPFDDA